MAGTILLVLTASGLLGAPVDAPGLTAEQALERYAAAVRLPEQITFNMVRDHQSGSQRRVSEMRVQRDGGRWELLHTLNVLHDGEPAVVQGRPATGQFQRLVVLGEREFGFSRLPPGSTFPPLIVRDDGQGPQRLAGMIDGGSMCFALPWGRGSTADILADCTLSLRPEPEVVDGRALRVLQITGPEGTVTLWLDPTEDDLPRKITAARDYMDEVAGGDAGKRGGVVRRRREFTTQVTRIENLRGRPMVTEAAGLMVMFEDGQPVQRWTSTLRISGIDASPDFRGTEAFKTTFPDGMFVGVAAGGTLRVNFVWKGGEVVEVPMEEMAGLIAQKQKEHEARLRDPGGK